MLNLTFIVLLCYLIFQFSIGYIVSRFIKTEADYFVAGRSFPMIIVAVSLFATWFGAETTIGSSGAVYAEGISGSRADPFGYGLCLVLAGVLIAGRVWSKKYITLSDFYKDRFGLSVEQLAVWVLSASSLIWAAAQLRAFGQVISASTSWNLELTLLLGFLCVVSYTLLGGLMGDMITDFVQAIVISGGLILLLVITFLNVPDLTQAILNQPAERLSLIGEGENWPMRLERWAIPILGSLVAQEIISRIFSAHSKSVAVKACYLGAGIYLVMGSIPVILGLVGPGLVTIEGDSEQFLIHFASEYLSPIMLGVFLGAIVSALLATIDSILLAVGALVSHNFVIPRFKIRTEKSKLLVSRLIVLIAGLVVYLLAVHSDGIYELLEIASSFGTAGILVITLFGLWTKFGDAQTAFITLIVGIATTPIADYVLDVDTPFLLSIAFALVTYIVVGLARRNASKIS